MRIGLEKLGKEGLSFAHVYQTNELELGDEDVHLTSQPTLNGRIGREGREVRVKGTIAAEAEVDCGRCLKSIVVPIKANFDVNYVPARDYGSAEVPELSEDDLNLSVFQDETIDIDELAREQILLALPSRALCSEDCKGLCPICGNNRNMQACQCESTEIDPRWSALKNLIDQS